MKKIYKTFSTLKAAILIIVIMMVAGCTQNREIRLAVENQLKQYPESNLQDIYKGFFQDEYGPGHLVENVAFAREYFDLELEEMVSRGRHDAEPCGLGKNFVRVPMDLVKDGLITDEDFFKAFIESSVDFRKPDITTWKQKWGKITHELDRMDLQIPNYERDKAAISKWLDRGETVIHHSDKYNDTYDPHYRIMGKAQWDKLRAALPRE
jgi:hypothetical protein